MTMKAVQAKLLYSNLTNETTNRHLCPEGPNSWCKWEIAKVTGGEYKNPLPDAIVQLLQPTYSFLGSRSLLKKCVQGYRQNANETLHTKV